ncbi:DMT family transporter [Halocynthiibacter styelae]|uniref:DMT family transporter n=1 Tax=Halocynthiibacter styelae TaxID=2761955 RepID=A0A8J7IF09_9RHOB|nr:DMT family transporter [Paenihalocynthiibacter styelae]MBI1494382.1 DMT family transporter [Paenihalocynthiibacter styelae]
MFQPPQNIVREIFLLVILSFLWGGSFTLIEFAIDTIPPATIVFGRLAIGASILLLAAFWSGVTFPKSRARWGALLLQGILQSALPFTLISWGQKHIDSGLAGLLNTTPPLFIFLIGYFVLRDRAAAVQQFIGLFFGFIGVLIIMGPSVIVGDESTILGQLAITGASISYAFAALNAKKFSDQSPVLTAVCAMAFAALLMAPVSYFVDDPLGLSPTTPAIVAVCALGVFSTAIAMMIYFRLVRTLGPLGVTTGGYMRAGFSVLLGSLLLGETLSATLFVGLMLIFAGVAIVTGLFKMPSSTQTKA